MSARRWWLVRASQDEVVAAGDHRLVPGAVGPANRDGWVTVAHSGGDPHGLLTDRPQLQVVPAGDELTVLVRREGGEMTTWTGGAKQDTASSRSWPRSWSGSGVSLTSSQRLYARTAMMR